jgi:D-alanine-D-alanine ligase
MEFPLALPRFTPRAAPIRLWLLMGGMSPEHEVSLSSALTALEQFEPGHFLVRGVCIRRDGRWCLAPEMGPAPLDVNATARLRAEFTAKTPAWPLLSPAAALAEIERDHPALAVIIMHGPQGEDGRIQGLLEGIGLPYTGSGVASSALAMDKRLCQRLLRGHGLPVPDFAVIDRAAWLADGPAAERETLSRLGLPCVVKPNAGGSSVGITIARDPAAWRVGVEEAFARDPAGMVLCERFIDGPEITCGVLDIPQGDGFREVALVPTEIIPREGEFFDYHCKYTAGASEEITPARIGDAMTREIQRLSLEVHRAVGASGFSRVDFRLEGGRTPLILEINTIPGLTPTSLLPQGAAALGITYAALLNIIVYGALNTIREV